MRGKFITIEGPDGAGKSTQLKKIEQFLVSRGRKVLVTREPGGTILGEKLRDILLKIGDDNPVPEAEALIYAASRAQLVKKVIEPALDSGSDVLCDRFIDSSLAYQGWARGLGYQNILDINKWFLGNNWPDLTILLDIDPCISIKRLKGKKDRLENESLTFHTRVREGFIKAWQSFPDRIKIIDASKKPEEVFKDIVRQLSMMI
jgi:dTMP kinase